MKRKRVVVLGATGSIGQSARKVARDIPERMEIVGLSAHSNAEGLREAQAEFPEARAVLSSAPDGEERLVELAQMPEAAQSHAVSQPKALKTGTDDNDWEEF